MQVYDVIMIVVLLGAVAFGFWKGLAWQIASFAAIVVSYFASITFRGVVAGWIDVEPPWNMLIAMLILFLGSSLSIWVIYRFVKSSIDKAKLKDYDRHTGAVLGAVKGVVLCMVITLFSVTLLGEKVKYHIVHSYSGALISRSIDSIHVAMPEEVHQVIHPALERLDAELDPNYVPDSEKSFNLGDAFARDKSTSNNDSNSLNPFAGAIGGNENEDPTVNIPFPKMNEENLNRAEEIHNAAGSLLEAAREFQRQ